MLSEWLLSAIRARAIEDPNLLRLLDEHAALKQVVEAAKQHIEHRCAELYPHYRCVFCAALEKLENVKGA